MVDIPSAITLRQHERGLLFLLLEERAALDNDKLRVARRPEPLGQGQTGAPAEIRIL